MFHIRRLAQLNIRISQFRPRSYFSTSPVTNQHIAKCPSPSYDTGCTYCQPQDMTLFETRRDPNNTSPFFEKIVLLDSGTEASSWGSKVELVPGSFANDFAMCRRRVLSPEFPISLLHTDSTPSTETGKSSGLASLTVFPDNLHFPAVPKEHVEDFMQAHLLASSTGVSQSGISFESMPAKNSHILICGHAKRDARCGEIGPLLKNEFVKVLSDKQMLAKYGEDQEDDNAATGDKWQVSLCSHVGGHVVSINGL